MKKERIRRSRLTKLFRWTKHRATIATVDALHALCSEHKGDAKVLFDLDKEGDFMAVMEAGSYNVVPDRDFLGRVKELCGRDSVRKIS